MPAWPHVILACPDCVQFREDAGACLSRFFKAVQKAELFSTAAAVGRSHVQWADEHAKRQEAAGKLGRPVCARNTGQWHLSGRVLGMCCFHLFECVKFDSFWKRFLIRWNSSIGSSNAVRHCFVLSKFLVTLWPIRFVIRISSFSTPFAILHIFTQLINSPSSYLRPDLWILMWFARKLLSIQTNGPVIWSTPRLWFTPNSPAFSNGVSQWAPIRWIWFRKLPAKNLDQSHKMIKLGKWSSSESIAKKFSTMKLSRFWMKKSKVFSPKCVSCSKILREFHKNEDQEDLPKILSREAAPKKANKIWPASVQRPEKMVWLRWVH